MTAFDSPIGGDIQRYFVGAESSAEERLKLLQGRSRPGHLSAFGGRQELYERFYGGDPFALRSSFWFNQVDWSGPDRLVDDCLAAFDVQTALKETQSQ